MCTERGIRLESRCHLDGQISRKPTFAIDRRQLLKLDLRVRCKFQFLATPVGLLGVGLSTHRDVLADSHGHRPGGEGGYTGREDRIAGCTRCDQPDEQGRGGHEAIIGTKHRRPEPAGTLRAVTLNMGKHKAKPRLVLDGLPTYVTAGARTPRTGDEGQLRWSIPLGTLSSVSFVHRLGECPERRSGRTEVFDP